MPQVYRNGQYVFDVKPEIREHFKSSYREQVKRTRPVMEKFRSAFMKTGWTGTVLGVIGAVTTGIMAFCSSALVIPALIGTAALLAVGIPTLTAGFKIEKRMNAKGDAEMEKDIDSYKLVKSFVKAALPQKTQGIADARKAAEKTYRTKLQDLDKEEGTLGEQRTAALELLKKGMTTLERQAEEVQQDLAFFKQETQHALGGAFDANANKPAPLPTAAQDAAVTVAARSPSPLQSGG